MGNTKLPAQDLYVGAVKIFNADGSIAEAVTLADNDVTAAKIAADAVTTTKILDANVTADKLAANSVITAKILDANVTLAKLAPTAKTHILSYQVEDLAANTSIANRAIFYVPTGVDVTLVSASIIPQGDDVGIDDSSTCVIKLSDGANTIVEKTYNQSIAFPDAAAVGSLGALDTDYTKLEQGDKLYLSVTNGTLANPPAFMLQVVYTIADHA
jgi:hypothetical protein